MWALALSAAGAVTALIVIREPPRKAGTATLRMVVHPLADPDEFTEIEYLELELGAPVDSALFSRRRLRRIADE